jgi:hypothetical protein
MAHQHYTGLSLLRDYDSLLGRIQRALEGRNELSALDSLGHHTLPFAYTPNPNNRPIFGWLVQRNS